MKIKKPHLASVFSLALALLASVMPLPANAGSISVAVDDFGPVTVKPPSIVNLAGDRITTSSVSQQVIIETAFHNLEEIRQTMVGYVEIRDSHDVTQYVAWQSLELEPRSNGTFGLSWSADEPSQYTARVFAINGFEKPARILYRFVV